MDFAIKLTNVSRQFGAHRAVAGVSLTVAPGELVGIVGPDGAGKTTLARLAAGVLAPGGGTVEPESRGRVGYLSGRFSLYPELTVRENLLFFAKVYGMTAREAAAEADRLLAWVGLLEFKARLAGALSGGMRQKLALACAVVHHPPTLILDEPTTAVDPLARVDFWALLQEQARAGRAVLVTTPYMDEAEHCDRVVLLHQGQVLATGTAAELKTRVPCRMALLAPGGGAGPGASAAAPSRADMAAAASALPGLRWAIPLGAGIRVALDPGAPLTPPPGYTLTPVPANLEDAYLWLTGATEEEVPAR
ncbi:MAG: transporter related protein [Symbiobacteriaceae bacterium]|jgi:ABC-2 type transport system ATP-binding protein|nr:transporter related protein [Symbiobacteriaceae bacterium]